MGVLINGNGNARIYAGQDADWFASIAGNVTCRTSVGNKMAAAAVDASTIGVSDGVIITKEGRRIQLDAGLVDLFEIPTGSAGVTNYYIIGYHLFTGTDGTQEAETFVRLMSSASETITEDTFRGGASDVYVSVARVQQVGVNLGTITPLLPELSTINQINSDLASKKIELLWTNVNPNTDFANQDININLSNYDEVAIYAKYESGQGYAINTRAMVGDIGSLMIGIIPTAEYALTTRTFNVFSDKITVGKCYAYVNGTSTEANGRLIPYKIYGIKY